MEHATNLNETNYFVEAEISYENLLYLNTGILLYEQFRNE